MSNPSSPTFRSTNRPSRRRPPTTSPVACGSPSERSTNDASACCGSSRSRIAPTMRVSLRTSRCRSGPSGRHASAVSPSSAPYSRATDGEEVMTMENEDFAADAALFARLRGVWEGVDPVPADLVDRMVAAVAVQDLSREYALLTLVEGSTLAAVRGEADTATLQFSDGDTSVLLHVTATEDGSRRVDGWVDAEALAIRLVQGDSDWTAEAGEHGRFAFDSIPAGVSRLRMVVRAADGELH